MTILEQILAGLQQKFAGVDTAILTRIATKKAEGVTDETKVNSIVEGISFSDVLNSYGDFRAGDASKTAVSNYEKKHNLKDGKPIETTTTTKTEENKDDVPAWAQALIDSNKNLSDKLTQLETEKAQATRSQQILAKAKEYGIPENYAKRCAIKDDEDLDAYFKDLKQEFANDGFKGVVPPAPQIRLIIRLLQDLRPKIHPKIISDSLIIILYIKHYLQVLNNLTIMMPCGILLYFLLFCLFLSNKYVTLKYHFGLDWN